MKFHHIGNATFVFETKNSKILCDPWFNDGIWLGTWYHYPEIKINLDDIIDTIDYLYISHVHEDHFEKESLMKFNKDIPIICLDRFPNFVFSNLTKMGFTNFIKCEEYKPKTIDGKFDVVCFGSPTNEAGELIDSSILFDFYDEGKVFNANDNAPSHEQLEYINNYKDGKLRFSLMPQGGGSAFPVMYDSLNSEEKKQKSKKNVDDLIEEFSSNLSMIDTEYCMPVGGQFVIAGNSIEENKLISKPYLETQGPNHYIENFSNEQNFLFLKSGDIFDFETRNLIKGDNIPFTESEKDQYIKSLKDKKKTELIVLNKNFKPKKLFELFRLCRQKQWEIQNKLNIIFDYNVYIETEDNIFHLNYQNQESKEISKNVILEEPYMKITLSSNDLVAILIQMVDWNHSDGSYRLSFYRKPEKFIPKAYTLLSFLHL